MDTNLWKIESLRLTNFVDSEFDPKNLEKWLIDITGEQPLQINKNASSFSGLSKLEKSIVKLQWSQNRINLIESSDAPNIKNNIGDFSSFPDYCKNHILKYFKMEDCPISDRLALGVILYLPITNYEEGIKTISHLLKTVSNIEDSEDFQFRINRPIQSKIAGGMKLNRLLTWTIGKNQIIQIKIQNGTTQNIQPINPPEFKIRLEFDLSTDQKLNKKLSINQQEEVIDELINIVNSVAESGEYGLKLD